MNYKTAYKKLKEAKVEALANSTNIKVGQRELNKALKALENMEKLRIVYEKILEMQREVDQWDQEHYERVLELLGPLVEKGGR